LTWITPLPSLVLAPRVSKRVALAVAFVGWGLGGFTWWNYLHTVLELPIWVFVVAVLSSAVVFALGVLLARMFLIRGSLWRASLALPVVWVTYEYLNALISPHSTFGNPSYTQMNFLPIIQVASVTGVWGIEFLLFLLPSSIAVLLTYTSRDRRWKAFATVTAAVFAVVIGLGSLRAFSSAQGRGHVTVGLMASDTSENVWARPDEQGMRILQSYADQIGAMAMQGAQTIVLPEKIATVSDAQIPEMDNLFQSAASANHVNILVGVDHREVNDYRNEARLYRADHAPVTVYVKHHLVPGFEARDRPGTDFSVLNTGALVQGLAICKDMDFPRLSRHYGQEDVALLLVPAWDFNADRWLHDRMAVMRGVENGFTIARAAKQGLLTISDDRGRVLAEQRSDASPFSSLVVVVPIYRSQTIYSRLGDWFAWVNLLLLMALIGSAMASKRVAAQH
jgi:apolipoprotein N-acyltransferase